MARFLSVAWVAVLLICAGCADRPGMLVSATGTESIGGTAAVYYASSERVLLVIWHDFRAPENGAGNGTSNTKWSAGLTEIQGDYSTTDGRGLAWACETRAGRSGTVTIGDLEYDLAQGCVFLVTDATDVVQLSREIPAADSAGAALSSLAESDAVIGDFVAAIAELD